MTDLMRLKNHPYQVPVGQKFSVRYQEELNHTTGFKSLT